MGPKGQTSMYIEENVTFSQSRLQFNRPTPDFILGQNCMYIRREQGSGGIMDEVPICFYKISLLSHILHPLVGQNRDQTKSWDQACEWTTDVSYLCPRYLVGNASIQHR